MSDINVKIYEDNGGGIHAVVRTDGTVINCLTGLEYEYTRENNLTGADLIDAAKGGFEYADDYDPDDFDGTSLEDMVASVENEPSTSLIAEITADSVDLDYSRMGAEGHYLFGCGEVEE